MSGNSTSARLRRTIPEPSERAGWYRWAMNIVLWWRERDLSREPLKPSHCISTNLPSAAENGTIIWADDLGQPVVSFNGNWFPLTVGGAI